MKQALQYLRTETKVLVQTVQGFKYVKNPPKAVRQTTKIICLLNRLISKLAPSTDVCQTTSADVLELMNSPTKKICTTAHMEDKL